MPREMLRDGCGKACAIRLLLSTGTLIARRAALMGRRVVFAAQIDQIRKKSRTGDNRRTQWQGVKKCDEVHFDSAASAVTTVVSIPSLMEYYDQVSAVLDLIFVVRVNEEKENTLRLEAAGLIPGSGNPIDGLAEKYFEF
jgi:hypothetical protein